MATIVQVFDPKFYEVCGICGMRARESDGKYICNQHGETQVNYAIALTTILDDGTSTIRTTFFRNQAMRLIKKSQEEILALKEMPGAFSEIKDNIIGKTILLSGRVKKNQALNNIEFVPVTVNEPDIVKELEKIQKNMDKKITSTETNNDDNNDELGNVSEEDMVY